MHMSPALNKSSVMWCFEHSGAIEIRNGIIFNFYTGLPHIWSFVDRSFVVGNSIGELARFDLRKGGYKI